MTPIPVIEREGRYFLQFEDGELERTPEQIRQFMERSEAISNVLKEHLTAWENKFKKNPLATGQIPKNSWSYVSIDDHMQAIKQVCQQQFNEGKSLEACSQICEMAISTLKKERDAPHTDKDLVKYYIAGWKDVRRFIAFFPATPKPEDGITAYPWAEIDALAEQIGLRKSGGFTPASNKIKAAVAGFIDALRDANTVPAMDTLPQLYAAFSVHYGREVGADRSTDTRISWHLKGRKALGLPDLKPPKL
jgi:hypothetical protein